MTRNEIIGAIVLAVLVWAVVTGSLVGHVLDDRDRALASRDACERREMRCLDGWHTSQEMTQVRESQIDEHLAIDDDGRMP